MKKHDIVNILVETRGITIEQAEHAVKNMGFAEYRRIYEANVDKNPAMLKGTVRGGAYEDLGRVEDEFRNRSSSTKGNTSATKVDSYSAKAKDKSSLKKDYDPNYIPKYIKNRDGDIDYNKIEVGDRIAYVDDYGKTLHGVVSNKSKTTVDLDTYYGPHKNIDVKRTRVPRDLYVQYRKKTPVTQTDKLKSKLSISPMKDPVGTAKKIDSVVDTMDALSKKTESIINEISSAGAISAASIAGGHIPSVVGDVDRRPSDKLRMRERKNRDNRKKRQKRKLGLID